MDFRFSSLLGKAIGLSVLLSIIAGTTLSIITFLGTFEHERQWFDSSSIAELQRISQSAVLLESLNAPLDSYLTLVEQSVEGRPISALVLKRDGQPLATYQRPMPESSRPILDLLTPRGIPFSYRHAPSSQNRQYTVTATFDAHEAFANFAAHSWQDARTGFMRAMTVALIVSLVFYFLFARPIQNILSALAVPAKSPINIHYRQDNQDEIGRLVAALNHAFLQEHERSIENRTLFEALRGAPDPCWVFDAESGDPIFVNAAACEALELPENVLLKQKLWDLAKNGGIENYQTVLDQAKQKGTIKLLREVTTPSGIDKTFEISVRYVVLNDQGIAVLFARDVGEREALLARASASERFKAIAEMAGAIAHDLNNKLMVAAGHLEILKDGLRLPDPSIDKGLPSIEKAESAVVSAAESVDQLLIFSGRKVLQREKTDLRQTLVDLEPLLQRRVRPPITFEMTLGPLEATFDVDRQLLSSSLIHLIENAVEAMEDGGDISVTLTEAVIDQPHSTTTSVIAPGTYGHIQVKDNGIGISDAHRDKMFEPFFTTKGRDQRRGLGLSMVYGFIVQSGGHINLDSAPGEGTTVDLWLPSSESAQKAAP